MVSALGASWGSLEIFLAHLVGPLAALVVFLGASWGQFGSALVSLGASLGPSDDRLGGCWVPLGGGWRLLESLLARLVSFWVLHGALGVPWA